MKTKNRIIVAVVIFCSCISQLSILAQGSLTPPGAPAPTMKTADQIYAKLEARIPIGTNTTPGDANNLYIITNSGSYYLTTNILGVNGKTGIEISANNVTLDLNGFTLLGGPGSIRGITIYGYSSASIRNGSVSGWSDYGIDCDSGNQFERLSIDHNKNGLYAAARAIVRDCQVSYNTNVGIEILNGGIISGCSVAYNGKSGIHMVNGGGNKVCNNSCIGNNTANDANSAGIYIESGHNRIEENMLADNGHAGIAVGAFTGAGNIIIKNSVSNSGLNYSFDASQVVGPLITTTVSGVITNSNPWANFSF